MTMHINLENNEIKASLKLSVSLNRHEDFEYHSVGSRFTVHIHTTYMCGRSV